MNLTDVSKPPSPKRRFATLAAQGVYDHEEASYHQGALTEPAYLTTAQSFINTQDLLNAADGTDPAAWVYTRRANPTVRLLEHTIAKLEGYQVDAGVEAVLTTTGMAAVSLATSTFLTAAAGPSPNIVASPACYGSTRILFEQQYAHERGVEVRWIDDPSSTQSWAHLIDTRTRFVYVEAPSNPVMDLVDLTAVAHVAHAAGVPLIVDATLATPALLRPIGQGVDVVIHSLTKAIGASGSSMGGAIVARRDLTASLQPQELRADYATYLRSGPLRNQGAVLSPFNAWTLLGDLRELRTRVNTMCTAAMRVAQFLDADTRVAQTIYLGLPSHLSHQIAARDLWLVDSELEPQGRQNRFGFLLSFRPHGGAAAARSVVDRLRVFWRANNLGQARSTVTIPALTTHHQQTMNPGPEAGAVPGDLIRLSIGVEQVEDLIADLDQALEEA